MRPIEWRIVEAVRRAVEKGWKPKRFYLTEEDYRAIAGHGAKAAPIDGLEIRRAEGKTSRLACKGGLMLTLPRHPPAHHKLERTAQ